MRLVCVVGGSLNYFPRIIVIIMYYACVKCFRAIWHHYKLTMSQKQDFGRFSHCNYDVKRKCPKLEMKMASNQKMQEFKEFKEFIQILEIHQGTLVEHSSRTDGHQLKMLLPNQKTSSQS